MTVSDLTSPTHEKEVFERVRMACDVIRSLPPVKVKGYSITWPEMLDEAEETRRKDDKDVMPFRATPREIDEMEDVLFNWFSVLSLYEKQLLWKRGNHMGWKRLAYENHLSVRSVQRYIKKACQKILAYLETRSSKAPVEKPRFPDYGVKGETALFSNKSQAGVPQTGRPMQTGALQTGRPIQAGALQTGRPMQTGALKTGCPMQTGTLQTGQPIQTGALQTASDRPSDLSNGAASLNTQETQAQESLTRSVLNLQKRMPYYG